jgi:alginate O-acetyltransferase complex protein AlgI
MLFHTLPFAVFFAAFLLVYLPVRRQPAGVWVILVFSNIFYGWWNWKFLGLLWATIVVDYTLARILERTEPPRLRKLIVAGSLAVNLGILGFFKYYNFLLSSLGWAGWEGATGNLIADLTLPVGISFYVFQSLSYILDVYRHREPAIRNLIQYAAFVCYFPQLVAGPIERLGHLLPQITAPAAITAERVTSGVFLFCVGLFRKAMADTLAGLVDPVFANLPAAVPVQVVMAVLGFGLQIYLDFTGYVDMARGVSRVIGIDLMVNFEAPYLSTSPREFWRRWHISLSRWLRDYLYISLGGSRLGLPRHLANLMVTMLLGGLWHGAGFNFVIWGGLHGLYLVLNVLWDRFALAPRAAATGARAAAMKAAGWLFTWIGVNYAWIYFRVPTFQDAMLVNRKLFEWIAHPALPDVVPGLALLIALVVAMEFVVRFRPRWSQAERFDLDMRLATMQGAASALFLVAGLVLMAGVPAQQFIYFQF